MSTKFLSLNPRILYLFLCLHFFSIHSFVQIPLNSFITPPKPQYFTSYIPNFSVCDCSLMMSFAVIKGEMSALSSSNRSGSSTMNSPSNHVSNTEENILRQLNSSDHGINKPDLFPNSTDLILNESSNETAPLDNSNTNETDVSLYVNPNISTLGTDPENTDGVVEVSPKSEDNILPNTAVLLETEWGSKVYVVGTAHFSEQSQEDVARVIRAVHPNFVVLELCESRSYMLKWEENQVLKLAEKMDFKMMNNTMRTYGLLQSVMYLLLLSVSVQITKELGMAPGGEFRRAYKEAMTIPGCVVHLGDRPIEITLRRAFASMSWWQKIKFAYYIIFCNKKIDENEIEKCKNRDYLEEMLGMFGGEFPELKKVFVNERDLFLSFSLLTASMLTTSPQGVIPNTVVGVVGMGHVPGIQRNWQKIDPVEVKKILQIPPPSRSSKILKFTAKAFVLFLVVYGIHKRQNFPIPSFGRLF